MSELADMTDCEPQHTIGIYLMGLWGISTCMEVERVKAITLEKDPTRTLTSRLVAEVPRSCGVIPMQS